MGRKSRKNPSVKDYGGFSYGRRPRRTRLVKEKVFSFRCSDCGHLRYVLPRELGRASPPRCLRCGGTLIETEPSRRRRLERGGVLRAVRSKVRRPANYERGVRCKACGVKWRNSEALAAHLVRDFFCRKYYLGERLIGKYQGNLFLLGSVYCFREDMSYRPWFVKAVTPEGTLFTLGRCRNQRDAIEFMQEVEADQKQTL